MSFILQRKRHRRFLKSIKRRKKYLKRKHQFSILPKKLKPYHNFIRNAISKKLPCVFSIKENTKETLSFINDVKNIKSKGKNIYFNMNKVSSIDEGTIALFVSIIKELSSKKYKIVGSKPKDKTARKILEKSGFFEHLDGSIDEENRTTSNTILTEGQSKTEQETTSKIVRKSINFLTGQENSNCRFRLQRLFIELMANAIDHGFKDRKNAKWFMSYSEGNKDSEKICKFAFVDNGRGIVETLKMKDIFEKVWQKIYSIFKGDSELLFSAFKGEIGSRTGLEYRGKGLPTIYETLQDNIISNLFVLTNRVILDFKNQKFYSIDVDYKGTFYYFELSNKNLEKNDN
ncbi:STAS domain-containing protein [Capnocytophaga stomatis]|uniref:STAS domain-containing protein n=1 Tax=Capnocytophaga stomatis TaxID=1848904 RepID=UPI001AC174BF|nr:STAS domain-containing protein [Capnocytophaga stomatis]GIM48821.1 hypothetical protein CAPN003_02730 [Capnocytophaga stomatis]